MSIELGRRFAASLAYRVLAHLDLGQDAANLYDGRSRAKPWVKPLEAAYLAAGPERLELQFAGLAHAEPEALRARANAAGTPLWRRFAEALDAEHGAEANAFAERELEAHVRLEEARRAICEPLQRLRTALWAPRTPPPLTVLDIPALGRRGRGYPRRDRHWVGVSLDWPMDQVLCQIFHEEVHPISDRELGELGGRDTREEARGASVHRRIEAHALARGAELLTRIAPELGAAYERWRTC